MEKDSLKMENPGNTGMERIAAKKQSNMSFAGALKAVILWEEAQTDILSPEYDKIWIRSFFSAGFDRITLAQGEPASHRMLMGAVV